jgi:predicted aldo/keto reductase-like oxidoreductase
MGNITRREFLAGMAATGAAVLSARPVFAEQPSSPPLSGADMVTLGRSGLQTSRLGIGTGTRSGREQRELGEDKFTQLARHAYDRGIRYIDTADRYGTHPHVRSALRELPREEMFIQSKIWPSKPETARDDIERLRRELDVDYIDSLLLHCMRVDSWPADMRPFIDAVLEAKEKGHVRAVGVSCHGWGPLTASVDCDWIDIQLARINPFEASMDGPPEDVAAELSKMSQAGRGVIGMKVFGNGKFASDEQRFESLQYVLGLECVDAFTIGFSTPEQIDETLEMIEKAGRTAAGSALGKS